MFTLCKYHQLQQSYILKFQSGHMAFGSKVYILAQMTLNTTHVRGERGYYR